MRKKQLNGCTLSFIKNTLDTHTPPPKLEFLIFPEIYNWKVQKVFRESFSVH